MDLTSFFQSTLIPDMKKEEAKKPEKKQGTKKESKKGTKPVRYRLPVTLYSNYTEPVIIGGDEFPEELTESEILKEARERHGCFKNFTTEVLDEKTMLLIPQAYNCVKKGSLKITDDISYGSTLEEHQAAFEKWGDTEMDADRRARYPEDFVPLTPQEQSLLNKLDSMTEDMLLGDDGDEGPLITGTIETDRRTNESYAMLLCRTAFRYNRKLAYMENGADWGGGIVPSDRCPKGMAGLTGIGNPEYIQMLYMYTFGYVPDGLMDMDRISETCNNIAPEELKTGDIAVMELEDGRKDFAVCIGAYKEIFLFAHCVNTADSSFPGGCARICFMTSQTDSYYRGSGPTDFTSFYQSPVGFWGNPDNTDSTGEILTTQTSNEATTWLALSQYLQHILAKSFILQHTNSKSLSTLRV